MTSNEIRQVFLDFFNKKSHQVVPSAPMVVKNDPTLMFTNAGMNQFKDLFLGNEAIKFSRATDTQKCLRVSGKHNDLEEVGHDTYHHTMFEMLGNWSFGDYFKEEAIAWAWELLVDVYGLSPDRLYASIFEGDEKDGVERDIEAFNFWKKVLPEERIINGNKKDNFWEMGDTGPCGPCSEVHIDLRSDEERAKVSGRDLVNMDHPQVVEIWNLVFIQYNRKADGSLIDLPAKHVDTGMGFERLCMALQNKQSNYDTDVFQPAIQVIAGFAGKIYGQDNESDIAMRVIADHVRAIAFAIADGQLPSNNKAGYVIRRILRRAVRYGYSFLDLKEAFIYKLIPGLVEQMGHVFPELKAQQELVTKVIREEEDSFLRTLETGLKMLDGIIESTLSEDYKVVSGKIAFTLYDTYGFPLDLTELILKEKNLVVNRREFDAEMEAQKNRSRNAASQEAGDWVTLRQDDEEEFIGYDKLTADVYITRYRKVKTKKGEFYHIVFNYTPFYAESGGQVGDSGYIEANGEKVSIIDTTKDLSLSIHVAKKLPTNPNVLFKAVVNGERRDSIASNHTATHLLDQALRKVLGSHVEQKGSMVTADYLRFDFSHFQKVTEEELQEVAREVNRLIRMNIQQEEFRNIPLNEAEGMGAIALFGEKYGDLVRVVKFGDSLEFCGGTHAKATGQIGFFSIVSESATSAGIRRIEAISGKVAEDVIVSTFSVLKETRQLLNNPKNLTETINDFIGKHGQLVKQIEAFEAQAGKMVKAELINGIEKIDGVNVIASHISINNPQVIKDLCFQLKGEVDNLFLVLGAEVNGKPNLSVMISDNLIKERDLNAGKIIREAAKAMKGGGGGQPFYATAGGKDLDGLDNAIELAKRNIR